MGIKTEIKLIETEEVIDIICDMCGKSCAVHNTDDLEFSRLSAEWGYNSSQDGETLEKYFCEDCTEKILDYVSSAYYK